jgi:hypothetical protein
MRKHVRSSQAHQSTHRQIRLPKIKKTTIPMRKDSMPTATLHSGLSNNKTTTEPAATVPIQAHQARKSALPKLIDTSISGLCREIVAMGKRGNGDGSIFRQKSGGWIAQYSGTPYTRRKAASAGPWCTERPVKRYDGSSPRPRPTGTTGLSTPGGIKRPRGTASPRWGQDSNLPRTRRLVAGFRRGPQREPLSRKRRFRL